MLKGPHNGPLTCLPSRPCPRQVALRYSQPDTQLGIIVGTGGCGVGAWLAG